MSKNKNVSSGNTGKKEQEPEKVVFYNHNSKKNSTHTSLKSNTAKRMAKTTGFSKKRIIVNIVSVFLGIIFIVAGSGCVVAYSYFNRINYKTLENSENSQSESNISKVQSESSYSANTIVEPYDGDLLNDPQVLNVMIFGDDRRSTDTNGNSDTMILLSIDTRHKKIKMLSFLRDIWVSIPGYGEDRINAAYPIGGAALAIQTVEYNFGIHIDRYAVIDFNSFTNIIDVLGGIDVELTDEEIDYINWQCWKNGQVETRDEIDRNSYTFHENEDGEMVTTVHLNSRQALWHARNRGQDGICSGDDFTRTQRQRNVVSIIISDLKNSDLSTILSVIYEIGPMITTNFKTSEITSLAGNIIKYLQYDIETESLPNRDALGTEYYFETFYPNGVQKNVICIYDWDSFRRKVAEFIYEDSVITVSQTTTE